MSKPQHNINKTIKNVLLYVLTPFLLTGSVSAASYGSGSYNDCKYSQGCSSSSSSSSTPSTPQTTTQPQTIVLLNSYPDFFTSKGINLNLKVGQVVYYEITTANGTQRYSITLKQIGANYVVLSFLPGGSERTLYINSTLGYDADGDGHNDIQIRLDSLTQDQASLNFKNLAKPFASVPKAGAATSSTHYSIWLIIGYIILILLGLGIFLWLFLRRRRDKNQNDPPNQIVTPGS